MRQVNLTTIKGGLNRLRTKGAALNDSLYDLVNGYVTAQKTVKVRPGTLLNDTLTTGTIGLVAFNDKRHVFASSSVSGLPSNYQLHVLREPAGSTLSAIHFAEPFLGSLYVAAEFDTDVIYHFWLPDASDWAADTMYEANELVQPTTANNYVYRATRLGPPYPVWTADTPLTVGDFVEPTTYNGLYFEVVNVVGAAPRTGPDEPDFDVEVGAFVTETVDTESIPPDPTPVARPNDNNPNLGGRYRRVRVSR